MKEVLELCLKLFSEPVTARRLFKFLAVAVFATGALIMFERYTATFRLARLHKEAELVARLEEIEARGTNHTAELERAQKQLRDQVVQTIEAEPVNVTVLPLTLKFSMDNLWKFFAGGAVFFFTAFFPARKWKSKEGRYDIAGGLCVAVLAGFLGILIRPIWWPWFHLFVYPLLFTLGVVFAIIPVGFFLAVKTAKPKAQAILCTNNLKQLGITSLIWAIDHNHVLPNDLDSIKKELGSENLTCCPADKSKRYEILSPGASMRDSSVVYARCPVHNLVVLADGTVQSLGKRQLVQERDLWRMKPTTSSPEG
jgi:hypothetical protein